MVEMKYDFGWALHQLRQGRRVTRRGWNGKGMWLELQVPYESSKMTLPYIFVHMADKQRVPWLASQTDMLAEDWEFAVERPGTKVYARAVPEGPKPGVPADVSQVGSVSERLLDYEQAKLLLSFGFCLTRPTFRAGSWLFDHRGHPHLDENGVVFWWIPKPEDREAKDWRVVYVKKRDPEDLGDPTALDYPTALSRVVEGKHVARAAWLGDQRLQEVDGKMYHFLTPRLVREWSPTPDDKNAKDWYVRPRAAINVGKLMSYEDASSALTRGCALRRAVWLSGCYVTQAQMYLARGLIFVDPLNSHTIPWEPNTYDQQACDWLLYDSGEGLDRADLREKLGETMAKLRGLQPGEPRPEDSRTFSSIGDVGEVLGPCSAECDPGGPVSDLPPLGVTLRRAVGELAMTSQPKQIEDLRRALHDWFYVGGVERFSQVLQMILKCSFESSNEELQAGPPVRMAASQQESP